VGNIICTDWWIDSCPLRSHFYHNFLPISTHLWRLVKISENEYASLTLSHISIHPISAELAINWSSKGDEHVGLSQVCVFLYSNVMWLGAVSFLIQSWWWIVSHISSVHLFDWLPLGHTWCTRSLTIITLFYGIDRCCESGSQV